MIRWARERSRIDPQDLAVRFPSLPDWESGQLQPTLRQLERYAHATRAPLGYFFLDEPPNEPLPLPDFRTLGRDVRQPSPDLLDTLYICQQRQTWYREHATWLRLNRADFVGSVSLDADVTETAAAIRRRIGFDLDERRAMGTWEDALRAFVGRADAAGVMVMCSGVVLNNNHRPLDVEEFRGFAIADDLAPLIFVNGADSKSAQMFTLAHELAHLWLGQSAISDTQPSQLEGSRVERWCNAVAAETLVPLARFRIDADPAAALDLEKGRLARLFKVSTLVVLRRFVDAGLLTRVEFRAAYDGEVARITAARRRAGGGNFYLSQAARVSRRFARALVESTLEGRTLYGDAMRLVGVSKIQTFNELGRTLGFAV